MNPLDKSWEFLKAPMEGGENKETLRRRAEARREKLRAGAAKKKADEDQPKLNLGPPKTGAPGSARETSDMHQRMADVHTAISNARRRIGTTPSTSSLDTPTEGTGFDTLTEQQKLDLKNRRKQSEEADLDARMRSLVDEATAFHEGRDA
tara:strand:- start:41 stop:490 length:450 start_codon:yes stop_codon:yes gene_type:complete